MSIFPFIDASGVTDTKKVTDLPLLKEYAYDYAKNETILDKGIMPSEKVLDFPVDCNTLTGSVNL